MKVVEDGEHKPKTNFDVPNALRSCDRTNAIAATWERIYLLLSIYRSVTTVVSVLFIQATNLLFIAIHSSQMSLDSSQLPRRSLEDVLPQEVLDIIFDNLTDLDNLLQKPKLSLFACSLVCKSWRERTLRHRFRSLSLYVSPRDDGDISDEDSSDQDNSNQDDTRRQEEERAEGGDPNVCRFALERFMQCKLFAPTKNIVRSLKLHYGTTDEPLNIGRSFIRFACRFQHLQSLELIGAFYCTANLSSAASPAFASIKYLAVRGFQCMLEPLRPSALCDILGAFGEIEELYIGGPFDLSWENGDADWDYVTLPRVTSLTMDSGYGAIRFAPLLKKLVAAQPLRKVNILRGEGCHRALRLVKSRPASLEHLLFTVPASKRAFPRSFCRTRICLTCRLRTGYTFNALRVLSDLKRITIVVEVHQIERHRDAYSQHLAYSFNYLSWSNVTKALQSLGEACCLEYVELVFAPTRGIDSPANILDPSWRDTIYTLQRAAEAIYTSEEVLLSMLQDKRLSKVRVALCRARPASRLHDNRFTWSPDESVRELFPRLDKLGALDS